MTRLPLAALLLAAPTAAAAPAVLTATTAAPALRQGAVVAGPTRWSCAGSTCTGPALNARFGDARACRELAKVAGAVASYQGARGPLGAEELAKCNGHAAGK